MSFDLSHGTIIFLVILGAACAVMIGYAMARLTRGPFDDTTPPPPGPEQEAYMREVRRRNVEQLYNESRGRMMNP
jgi:hypothetical protein